MSNYALSAVLRLKDEFTANIKKFGKATGAVERSSKLASSAVSKLDAKMKGMGKSALSAGKNLAKGFTAATIAGVGLSLKGAADMETQMTQLETAFRGNKEQAKDYFMWANKMANATPFENSEVIEATAKLS
ncbi:MAG: hypothetical protein ACRC6B_10015, partial [Fusobacteriaceae bacterium]